MTGARSEEDLRSRLSRLVAHGLMETESELGVPAFRFRNAATSQKQYGGTLGQLDGSLRALLVDAAGWSDKNIRLAPRARMDIVEGDEIDALLQQELR